jgi:hypothetical protein
MGSKSIFRLKATALLLFAFWLLPSLGALRAADKPIVEFVSNTTSFELIPQIAYNKLLLSVAQPNGDVIKKTFNSKEQPYFNGPLSDGQYQWEVSIMPIVSKKASNALKKLRETGDRNEVERLKTTGEFYNGPTTQSGSFMVVNGAIVENDLKEEEY